MALEIKESLSAPLSFVETIEVLFSIDTPVEVSDKSRPINLFGDTM